MKKRVVVKELIIMFWIFIIGSMAGYVFEMLVVLFQKGHFETRQGLIYGPFIPVYGIGAIMYYLILKRFKTSSKAKIFFVTALLGGITEYICSFVQEKAFGTISWDYSHLLFNFNGRTSLLHCTYWGIAGILYVLCVSTLLDTLEQSQKINIKSLKIITVCCSLFIIFDICISCVAAHRQSQRKINVPPSNKLDYFLDEYYPDEYMNKIFTNAKDVS